MPNRRDFFRTLASATAGLAVTRGAFAEQGQAPAGTRREISIGGRRVKVIDVHAHCVIPEVAAVVKGTPFEKSAANTRNALGPSRLVEMDKRGIDIQALSINGYWWYEADRDLATKIVRVHDEKLAAWCKAQPDRFVAFTSPALQFPDLAAEQLDYAVKQLGLRGASIGGHVRGEDLSGPKYDPFWAKASELGVLVFMHPGGAENVLKEDALEGRGDLGNIIGNPLETTVFLSRLIFDGTLDRFPALKICAAHAGGYLPSYLGRTEVACDVRANAECANKKRPSEYLKGQIFVDTMIFSEEGLRHLVAEMGASQLVFGTDIPFNWPASVDAILGARSLSDADKAAILGGNLSRLLRLTAS